MSAQVQIGNPADLSQEELLNWLVVKLQADFGGVVADELIRQCADEAVCALSDARIRNFVPVLAHRRATERLRASIEPRQTR